MVKRYSCGKGHAWRGESGHGQETGTDTAPVCPVCGAVACAETAELNTSPEPATVFLAPGLLEGGSTDSRVERLSVEEEPVPSDRLRVAGYEILGELGRGGMGVVYKARQVRLDRLVALKVVLAGVHAGPEDLARFGEEAKAVARLQHSNIVQVFEVGEHDGRPYVSFEYIDGGSLAQRLQGEPMLFDESARIIEVVARAVHCAHQQGVVHRDLKPANILLARSDPSHGIRLSDGPEASGHYQPKITDFGLAKRLNKDAGPNTQTGTVMGTPSYIAPEQAAGKSREIGPAADVYSLGAILYEMLTGRPPFRGQNSLDTMMLAMSEEPIAPMRLHAKVPRDLETICLKCLQKEPHKRYASAEALASDLRRFREGELIHARPIGFVERGWKWARRRPAVAALSVLLFFVTVAGFIGVVWEWRQASRARNQAEVNLEKARVNLYFNRIALAERQWQANLVGQAEQMLNDCPKELRHWEWHYLKRLCHANLSTLNGHQDLVRGVAYSPDGQRLASVSNDRTVRIWNAQSGETLATLRGHTAKVTQVAFSPDGQRLASGGEDRTVKLWDVSSGKLLFTLPHANEVVALAFQVDGKHLTVVSGTIKDRNREEVKIWDTTTGQEVRTLRDRGYCQGLSRDGRRLVSVDWSPGARDLWIWDVPSGQRVFTLPRAVGTGFFIVFSPDGQRLALPSEQQIKIWDIRANQAMVLCGHTDWVTGLAFSNDGKHLASASKDGTAKIWKASDGQEVLTLRGYPEMVTRMAFSPDSRRLAAVGDARQITIWDAGTGQEAHTNTAAIRTVAFSPDSQLLASTAGGGESAVKLWAAASGRELRTLAGHTDFINTVAFSPDGRRLASGSRDRTVKVWDTSDGKEVFTLSGHASWVTAVAFSPDANWLASASDDHTVKVWNAATGQEVHTLKGHTLTVTSVAFAPDSSRLASASEDGSVRVWSVETGQEVLAPLQGHRDYVHAVTFSPDGRRLASASRDATVKLWNAATGKAAGTLRGHSNAVVALAYSPDGERLVTGSWDKTVKIWNPASGQEILSLRGHTGFVTSVAFSPDLQRVASASDWEVKVWEGLHGE